MIKQFSIYRCSVILFTVLCAAEAWTQGVYRETPPGYGLLSHGEIEWVESHKRIIHGAVDGHRPFEYIDASGEQKGLTSEFLNILAEQLGIEFETIVFQNFEDLVDQMKAGNVHVASYLPVYWKKDFVYSAPMVEIPIVLFGRTDAHPLPNLESVVDEIVVVEDISRSRNILSKDYPEIKYVTVELTVGGIQAVNKGDADVFIHNIFSVEYFQRKHHLSPLKVLSPTDYAFDISFAVSDDYKEFTPIIDKVLADLSHRERKLIFDKWVNVEFVQSVDLRKIYWWGGGIITIFIAALSVILVWNKKLQALVNARTRELQVSAQNLRELAQHTDQVREAEKSKLAREIHDELGHTHTSIIMGLRQLAKNLSNNTEHENVKPLMDELKKSSREAANISRKIISDLRPTVLEDLGLVAAIEWLAHEFYTHHGIPCRVDDKNIDIILPETTATALFRITQEALTNIAKHARASNVEINLYVKDDFAVLILQDDGQGLAPGWDKKPGSFGVKGIQERVLAFHGKFSIQNREQAGVKLTVKIPLSAA